MKSLFLSLVFFTLFPLVSIAQSKWGLEFKGSRFNTTNSGELQDGSRYGNSYYTIDAEKDLVAYSQSLGLVYRINERNLVKLHLGNHQNGRVLSLTECYDSGGCISYTDLNVVFHYFQFAPSYTYRIGNKRLMVPVEVGLNFNFEIGESEEPFVEINNINFDYEISAGLDYRLDPELIIGVHGLFIGNINEYQVADYEYGTFKPKSLGLEFSIIYEFGKSIDKETEVR
ncbi:MAG TPA: hypothetical protein VFV79_06680 [Saprospiraceae bacterium]|nr:hypothetical protein [Saprospiraceae bacterium]